MDLRAPNGGVAADPSSELSMAELRHVMLLHRTRSFSRAAEMAGVSQSALSQSISRIEKRLGVLLFNRNRRSVVPTLFADLITERAESILNAADDLGARIRGLRESREGAMCFGVGVVPASMILSDALAAFSKRHADVQARAIVDYPDELAELAAAGEVEFLVVADIAQTRDGDSVRECLFQYEYAVMMRPDHPLAEFDNLVFRDVIRYPVVGYPNRHFQAQMLGLLQTSDEVELIKQNYPAVQIQQPLLLADLVATSDYVMLAPPVPLAQWLDSGRLVRRAVRDLETLVDIDIVRREERSLSPPAERMIEILHTVAGRLPRPSAQNR